MAKENLDKYKIRLRDYINKKGIHVESSGGADRINCLFHEDEKPSMIIYESYLHCPVCSTTASVFDFAGQLIGSSDFKEMLNEVKKTLGEIIEDIELKPKKIKPPDVKIVPLEYSKAKEIFSSKKILSQSEFVGNGNPKNGYGDKIIGAWPYKNEDGLVEIIDIRFEGSSKRKKNIISFYYDGKNIKSKNPPCLIYNRDLIKNNPDAIILIVEGAKTAKAAECLIEFGIIPVTWNGGSSKVLKPDWSCIYNRDVYFFPDDDDPGIKAAKVFGKEKGSLVNAWKIIRPYEKAREIKKKGADIVEVLQLLKPKELAEYILKCKNTLEGNLDKEIATSNIEDKQKSSSSIDSGSPPFKTLGTADDGLAYFIDRHNRLMSLKIETLTLLRLLKLADIYYWYNYLGTNKLNRDDQTTIYNDLIEIANNKDFDIEDLRGRGAWKESDGRICYHDGITTTGEYDKDKVFLRKKKKYIGIKEKPLDEETIISMKNACFELSFETTSDAMRLLSWAIISPFAGALDWRPQAFLTGPSSSGKSSIENYVVKPLAMPHRMNGGETTAAGYIQSRRYDSGAVIIEEADPDTEKKKTYKEDLLSIMRQSTSDDTPKGYKGTSDQTGKTYLTRDMFLFIAISPEIETVADDNRLVKINIKKPTNGHSRPWHEIKNNLLKNFNKENCNRLRATVWQELKNIISLANRISTLIQEHTGKDHRFAISEGTLMSAYFIIWKYIKNPTDEQLKEFIDKNYELVKPEDDRDDTEEIIEKILQYKIKVYLEKMKEYNVLEILKILKTGKKVGGNNDDLNGEEIITKEQTAEFRRAINNIGISIDNNENLAIANQHNEIKRITGRSNGYSRVLRRHKYCLDPSKNVVFLDKTRRCSIFGEIIEDAEIPF